MLKSTMKLDSGSVDTRATAGSHHPGWMLDKGEVMCLSSVAVLMPTHSSGR